MRVAIRSHHVQDLTSLLVALLYRRYCYISGLAVDDSCSALVGLSSASNFASIDARPFCGALPGIQFDSIPARPYRLFTLTSLRISPFNNPTTTPLPVGTFEIILAVGIIRFGLVSPSLPSRIGHGCMGYDLPSGADFLDHHEV